MLTKRTFQVFGDRPAMLRPSNRPRAYPLRRFASAPKLAELC
jgi:hypothetical protein